MKTRPRVLSVLAVSFLFIALVPLLKNFEIRGFEGFRNLGLETLGLLGTMISLIAFAMFPLTLRASRVVVPGTLLLLAYALWNLAAYREDPFALFNAAPSAWASALFVVHQPLWLLRGAHRPVMSPELRWWRTPQRVPLAAAAHVRTGFGKTFLSNIRNLSRKGILLDTKAQFSRGDLIDVRFVLAPFCVIHCRAEVVRREDRSEVSSYGLKILQMRTDSRVQLNRFFERTT